MTDALRILTENTAKYAGGSVIKVRYYDVIENSQNNTGKKSGDEIVKDIVSRAGLEIR